MIKLSRLAALLVAGTIVSAPTFAADKGSAGAVATVNGQPWNKTAPSPALPQDVIEKTAAKYQEALVRLTGQA